MYIGQDYSVILLSTEGTLTGHVRLTQAVMDEPCVGTRSIIKVEVEFITTTAIYDTVVNCCQVAP